MLYPAISIKDNDIPNILQTKMEFVLFPAQRKENQHK